MILGHVSMEELACLYRMATILVFPSLYEGFGLPLAEAMATGLPIVASDCSSIPEVVGDAGLLVEPDNLNGFRDGIQALLLDDDLRAEYSRKGRERAKHFTWERAAERTREAFQQILTRTD
jgi:alpha-1,3-rhamnosyl/mannosyltransferase